MDCLEFRRLIGFDPRVSERAAREHLDSCAFCSDAHARALTFEQRLGAALAVPVPLGLADRILLNQLTGTRQRGRATRRRATWFALAAAASIAVAVGVVSLQRPASAGLPDLVAAHVTSAAERDALHKQDTLPDADIRHAFADRGVRLASVPAGIAYVSECPVGPYRTVHMVMPHAGAPVSVVYVTAHRVGNTANFQRDGLQGREVPMGEGTLVMLAANADGFAAVEHGWRDALEGPARIAAASL